MVTDQKERDRVIKQSFSPDKVPPSLDAVIVGSGIGGLTTAALLARTGKKVCAQVSSGSYCDGFWLNVVYSFYIRGNDQGCFAISSSTGVISSIVGTGQ